MTLTHQEKVKYIWHTLLETHQNYLTFKKEFLSNSYIGKSFFI